MKRILFLSLSNRTGDTVITTGFLKGLRELYPNATIDVFITKAHEPLLKYNKDINHCITFEFANPYSIVFAALPLLMYRYDLLINQSVTKSLKRSILLLLFRFKKLEYIHLDSRKHITERYFKVLKKLGFNHTKYPDYQISYSETIEQKIESFVNAIKQQGEKILIFNPVGAVFPRQLQLPQIQNILNALKDLHGLNIILLDYKRQYSQLAKTNILFQSSDLLETAALISKADIVLSVDTGVIHIADTFNKKIIDLFPSYTEKNLPLSQDHIICWEPRSPHINLQGDPTVNEIKIEKIIEAVKTFI